MEIPSGSSAEQYLESRILAGETPIQALLNLIRTYQPRFGGKWKNLSDNYDNPVHPLMFKLRFEMQPEFKQLQLSNSFIQKWFVYPSGHPRTPMYFVSQDKFVDLTNKSVAITDPQITTKLIGIATGQSFIPSNCFSIVNGPLFIPVLRYQKSENEGGMIYGSTQYNENTYCGTYYYLDPGPQVYLLSNKTLIAPNPIIAYHLLTGTDDVSLNQAISIIYSPPITTQQRNKLENYLNIYKMWVKDEVNNCNNREVLSLDSVDEEVGKFFDKAYRQDMEQDLCILAKRFDIDAVILTYSLTMEKKIAKINIGEVIYVKDRLTMENNLFRST